MHAPQGASTGIARLARVGLLGALGASGMVAAFATIAPAPEAEFLLARTARVEPLALRPVDQAPSGAATFVREARFERGDTHAALLARLGVSGAETRALLRSGALRRLATGQAVTAQVGGDGALQRLGFLAAPDTLISVSRDGERFRADDARAPREVRTLFKSAVVRSSLFAAADTASIPDAIAMQLADIFGGDVDFHRDLRKGDRFSVVYEMSYLAGRPVRAGRVLAAEFVGQGRVLRALHFAGRDGKGGYFDPEGRSLRKAFLRSPLEYSRVTSGFGMRRHPFHGVWQAHAGIDYAAPSGTRVRAVGDGVVTLAGRSGGYGNLVLLRHRSPYTTAYAHLSGFARGVRPGARVAQGDTIGFVGQTGWATGPHLHYEFRIANRARNPLAVSLPAAHPVAPAELAAFRDHSAPLVAQLDLLRGSNLALLE